MRMEATIQSLVEGLPVRLRRGRGETTILELTEDSRAVCPGSLFIARRGRSFDGTQFIPDAVARGAAAVLHDGAPAVESGPCDLVCEDPAAVTPTIAERFFGSPAARLRLIGVTGTNGKTTTATLIRDLLNRFDLRCGLIGTVEVDDGRTRAPASLTTPGSIDLSRMLSRMVKNTCRAAVMEASSHALDQGRTAALSFDIAIFSNLSGDHLDYHKTLERYSDAKAILFASLAERAVAVVNADDPHAQRMLRDCRANVIRTSVQGAGDVNARILAKSASGTRILVQADSVAMEMHLPLVGTHNVSNALQAAAAVHACGVPMCEALRALESCSAPPGRLEPVRTVGLNGPAVLVDYAHTDDALDNVLRAVRDTLPPDGKMWVVFGCGGDRDQTKRPRMAAVACRLADRIVITSDNPRTEDPQRIIEQIRAGVPKKRAEQTIEIVDRRHAIFHAVAHAVERDVIVIAGKGHEDYQIIGTVKIPFDDRIIAQEALRERAASERRVTA